MCSSQAQHGFCQFIGRENLSFTSLSAAAITQGQDVYISATVLHEILCLLLMTDASHEIES